MKATVRSSESIVSLGMEPATMPQKRQSGSEYTAAGYRPPDTREAREERPLDSG